MKITPLDIRRKEFRRSVRGYLDEDVDVFLDSVADEFERISKVSTELEEKVRTLQGQVSSLEQQASGHGHIGEALEKTLLAAQLQSEEIRSNAQKESQSIVRDAEAKAKAVVDDFYAQTRAVQQTLMQLKLLEEDFRFKFRGLLEGYLKLLEEGPLVLPALRGDTGAPGLGTADATPSTKMSAVERARAVDDSPTSETAEVASVLGAGAAAAGPPKPALGPQQPPHLPETVPTGKTGPVSVQAPASGGATRTAKTPAGKQAKVDKQQPAETKQGGVFFGRRESDPDDPFPEIGGATAKPRDFEW